MLSEVEGASGGSLVAGSEVLEEEEVSGGGDGTSCPGEGKTNSFSSRFTETKILP